MTVRITIQTGIKVGHSDPIILRGIIIAQRITGTLGIAGLRFLRVLIKKIWHFDVDSSFPGGEGFSKDSAVRRLIWYVSWVQNVVKQFDSYLLYL